MLNYNNILIDFLWSKCSNDEFTYLEANNLEPAFRTSSQIELLGSDES